MNRLSLSVAAALLATGATLFSFAPTASGAVVQKVRAADFGPGRPWIRLQDDPSNAGRTPGIQRISPFTDPVRFDGSLHLAIGPGEQSQAAHYFPQRVPLGTIARSELSYDSYVDGHTSTATGTSANLQLPMYCRGAFTTISFQPQLATDSRGRAGVVPNVWQHFTSTGTSLWRTSRALPTVPPLAANSDSPLSTYVSACDAPGDGVIGVIANVGRLGDPTATLDTHVDNLAVNGTVYDFAVDGLATGRVTVNATPGRPCGVARRHCPPRWRGRAAAAVRVRRSADGTLTFTDPRNGPEYRDVAARLVLSRRGGLSGRDLRVTANGQPVALTAGSGRTLTALVLPSPGGNLAPGHTFRTSFTVAFADRRYGPRLREPADLTLTAQLLATGYEPRQRTGVEARSTLRHR